MLLFCVVFVALNYRNSIRTYEGNLSLSNFWNHVEANEVAHVNFGAGNGWLVQVVFIDGQSRMMFNPGYGDFRKDLMEANVRLRFDSGDRLMAFAGTLTQTFFLIVLMVICVIVLRVVMQNDKMKHSRALHTGIKFDDVRGMKETKEEAIFIVEQMRNRDRLKKLGARPVKGVLLEGPPGTGKTMLAKAIAGESGVPLLSANGSDFVEMFVGVGSARLRRLWQRAEDSSPAIIFLDELDALGMRRESLSQSHNEGRQTLNCLLSLMDGLVGYNILVIGATNRSGDLDPALLRAGRFDRILKVGLPHTMEDREDICDLYLSKISHDEHVTARRVAGLTSGMSGADIAQIINDSVLLSLKDEKENVTMPLIDRAITRHLLGGVSVEHATEEDRRRAAVHEAGHAIVRLATGIDVLKVSITPYTSGAGGVTVSEEVENKFKTEQDLKDTLAFFLGGMMAERVIYGNHSTGSGSDIDKASSSALEFVNCFGMNGLLNQASLRDKLGYRGITDGKIMEAERILEEESLRVEGILKTNIGRLKDLVEWLLRDTTVISLTPKFLESSKINKV
jgi:cell division protease FtsH